VSVGPDKKQFYAKFREMGTRPHMIRPVNKKALLIGDRFATWARHPGQEADPFLRPAFDSQESAAQAEIRDGLKKALDADG
jgi:HK97 gp10 family phage protein